jgi:hypothetical protein
LPKRLVIKLKCVIALVKDSTNFLFNMAFFRTYCKTRLDRAGSTEVMLQSRKVLFVLCARR